MPMRGRLPTFYGHLRPASPYAKVRGRAEWLGSAVRKRSSAQVETLACQEGEIVGEYVDPNTSNRWSITRFQPLDIHTGMTGVIEATPHWAGESVDGVKRV